MYFVRGQRRYSLGYSGGDNPQNLFLCTGAYNAEDVHIAGKGFNVTIIVRSKLPYPHWQAKVERQKAKTIDCPKDQYIIYDGDFEVIAGEFTCRNGPELDPHVFFNSQSGNARRTKARAEAKGDTIIRSAMQGPRHLPGPSRPAWTRDTANNPLKQVANEIAAQLKIDKHKVWRELTNQVHARTIKELRDLEEVLTEARELYVTSQELKGQDLHDWLGACSDNSEGGLWGDSNVYDQPQESGGDGNRPGTDSAQATMGTEADDGEIEFDTFEEGMSEW